MAFSKHLRLLAEFIVIFAQAYILLSSVGCVQTYIGGSKNMPFQTLYKDEFLVTEFVIVTKYGATGDGFTDDSSAITQAISSANNNILLFPAGSYKISNDITIPSNVSIWFVNGSKLSIDSGKTVTINGVLEAGYYQIFSGSGTAVIKRGTCEAILPQWWGAVGDGSNDDTLAIQSAINCANQTGSEATDPRVREVFLPNGIYKITSPLALDYGTSLRGSSSNSTIIDVYGGVNGINLTYTNSPEPPENIVLSNFRLRAITHGSGTGINVTNQRSLSIEHVWVGGWYDENYYFNKGIAIDGNPAYYCTIRRCRLFKNTYNIYMGDSGVSANNARIVENDIWYGDYGIYNTKAHGVRVINNTIENFNLRGIYNDTEGMIIFANWIESNGVYSVELGPNSKRTYIQQNVSVTGFGNESDVLDNSGGDYNRIYDNQIPIGYNSVTDDNWALAGKISCNLRNYHVQDVTIESIPGDLKLKTNAQGKAINLKGAVDVDESKFNIPNGGFGYRTENLLKYSEDFTNAVWYKWALSGGSITVTGNATLAPNGTLTADKMVSIGYTFLQYEMDSVFSAGDIINFSVWLRSDTAHDGVLMIFAGGQQKAALTPEIDTHWKRFQVSFIADASIQSWYMIILPNAGYPTYAWGAQVTKGTSVTGTDNSGVNGKTTKLIDTTKDFIASGIGIGGMVESVTNPVGSGAANATITSINSTLDFTTGSGVEPAVGATLTGGTSLATGTVVSVVITSGSFAGNNAAGYIEISALGGTFVAETVTYTGGSVACTTFYPNDVLVFDKGLSSSYGTPRFDFDNGDNYYACNSYACSKVPYVYTDASISAAKDFPLLRAENILSNSLLVDGKADITGDISAAGGFKQPFNYAQSNVSVSQTAVTIKVLGSSDNTEFLAPYAGSVIAISVASTEARSAGTLTVDATVNGTATGLQAILNGSNTTYKSTTQAKDTDTFSAGDRLGVKITTSADWAPTSADIVVTIFVEM
jgi:hypothetical protein